MCLQSEKFIPLGISGELSQDLWVPTRLPHTWYALKTYTKHNFNGTNYGARNIFWAQVSHLKIIKQWSDHCRLLAFFPFSSVCKICSVLCNQHWWLKFISMGLTAMSQPKTFQSSSMLGNMFMFAYLLVTFWTQTRNRMQGLYSMILTLSEKDLTAQFDSDC